MTMPETELVLGAGKKDLSDREPLHFLGYVACPFKQTFKEHMDETLGWYQTRTGIPLHCHIPVGCGDYDAYDDLWKTESIKEFPDVIASLGFGDFFRTEFVERFVKKGYFHAAWPGSIHPLFEKAGFRDPDEWYTVYSVWPYVLLIDKKRLGNRPIPRFWKDLLDPQYRDDIIIDGSRDHRVAQVPMLYFFKDHGEQGLIQLAANIRDIWHPAQMVKAAGATGGNGAAIYILPSFFAQARHRPEETPVVWPEDGAISSPVYFLAKATKRMESEAIVQALVSRSLGEKSRRAFFPSLNPEVDNHFPPTASFKWLGWEYIKVNDMEALKQKTTNIFLEAWDRKGKG
jgi:ABC-type Fe3+ transport system substrate-binding protein